MGVTICDVGPRDGMQNEPESLSPALRAELVSRLAAARLPRNCTLAATDTFNRRNGNASLDEAIEHVHAIVAAAARPVTVIVSCSFGCPFEGEVDPGVVADLCERLAAADELVLADTIGVATPRRVRRLVERVAILGRPVGAHLHNTRNTGYASAWAALEAGAEVLDASAGGLGGCPFSPNATGNVATEDLVWQLERDGVRTGIDLDALLEAVRWLAGLLGHDLEGQLHRAATWPSSAGS